VYHYSFLNECRTPKLFLSGDRDQFADALSLQSVFKAAGDPKKLVFVPAADHFFTGRLEPMQRALATWVKEQVS